MAGYAIIWLFVLFFGMIFLLMTTAYYMLRFASWLRRYWNGE